MKNCPPFSSEKLSTIFFNKGENIREVSQDDLKWVCEDEDVQLVWGHISPTTIEEKKVRQSLLKEITYIWTTTRGYSMAAKLKRIKRRRS